MSHWGFALGLWGVGRDAAAGGIMGAQTKVGVKTDSAVYAKRSHPKDVPGDDLRLPWAPRGRPH